MKLLYLFNKSLTGGSPPPNLVNEIFFWTYMCVPYALPNNYVPSIAKPDKNWTISFFLKKQKKQHFFQKTQVWTFPLLSVMLCPPPEQTTVSYQWISADSTTGIYPFSSLPIPPHRVWWGGEGVASPSQAPAWPTAISQALGAEEKHLPL